MTTDRYYIRDDGKLFCKKFECGRWVWYGKFPVRWGRYIDGWQPNKKYLKRIKYEDVILELI